MSLYILTYNVKQEKITLFFKHAKIPSCISVVDFRGGWNWKIRLAFFSGLFIYQKSGSIDGG